MIKIRNRSLALAISTIFFLILLFLFYETYNMAPSYLPGYPGDSFFPRLILIFLIFWNLLLIFQNLKKPFILSSSEKDREDFIEIYYKEILKLFIVSLIYIYSIELIGFEILTSLFLFILLIERMDYTFQKSLIFSLLISISTMFIFWIIFIIFLKIPFPLKFLPFLIY